MRNGAEKFVEALNYLGVDRIFLNPGIDLVPLMATIAEFRASQRQAPKVIHCAHESVAISAAHGYAMVSGKPQFAAVFEDVGTLQGGGAIVNLQYGRMPVILCAGKNQLPNRYDWMRQPSDQRRIIRDYVKWDYEISPNDDIPSVLREAYRIASTEPSGPVYITIGGGVLRGLPGQQIVTGPDGPRRKDSADLSRDSLLRAADILLQAENPLVMTAYSGRHTETVNILVDLAESLGMRVITTDLRMNFPSTHPLCPGIDAIKGESYDHFIAEADVLLLVDYHFPGPIGKRFKPRDDAVIIHLDMEPLKNGEHLWGRTPKILFQGDSRKPLCALKDLIQGSLKRENSARFRERFKRINEEHRRLKEGWRKAAGEESARKPISPEWLCYCINEELDKEAVIVHMLPSNADALSHQIRRTEPGTIFSWGENAGSMGWALGAALGAKLALPERLVVCLIGDGGFIYGCPVATLWGAKAHNAPFLTIIFNNHSYASFKEVISTFYGESVPITESNCFEMGIEIRDPPDYAGVASACGSCGLTVENPSELTSALRRSIAEVRNGTPAVLDVGICLGEKAGHYGTAEHKSR